jgi:uroporphyrinogen-III synthase
VTLPLAGVTVVVTRPRAQSARFAALVREAGGTPVLLPALEIEPLELDAAARARLVPDDYDWTIYTSANAVECSLPRLPVPSRTRVAAIGRATARALAERGVVVHAVPSGTPDSEGLLALDAFAAPAGLRILILKGAGGRALLREELARRGAEVVTGDVYRRVAAVADGAALAELGATCGHGPLVVAATSAESLAALLDAVPDARLPCLRDAVLLAPGERVGAAARRLGWRGPLLLASGAEDAAMAEALVTARVPAGPPSPPC